jgi:hypothetical protein
LKGEKKVKKRILIQNALQNSILTLTQYQQEPFEKIVSNYEQITKAYLDQIELEAFSVRIEKGIFLIDFDLL